MNINIVLDNAMMFIGGYMDVMHLEGRVDPEKVYWEIFKDTPIG